MNTKHRKTLAAIFTRPTSASIVFADIEALITEVGADKVAFLSWVSQMAGQEIKRVAEMPEAASKKAIAVLEKKRKPAKETA